MSSVYIISVLVLGIGPAYAVWKWPAFFWRSVLGVSILGAGIMIAGHAVIDEYLVGFLLLGGIAAAYMGRVSVRSSRPRSFHGWLFLLTTAYFAIESTRGMLVLHDPRMARWIMYYVMFGVLFLAAERWEFPLPSVRQTARTLGVASILYFGFYLGLGLFDECAFGISRWNRQGVLWAGSSYALFILAVSLPAAFYLLGEKGTLGRGREYALGWLTLFASIAAIGYYDSRVGWLTLFGFLILAPIFFGLRKGFGVILGILGISGLIFLGSQSVLATPHCRVIVRGEESFTETSKRLFDGEWYGQRAADFAEGMAATAITPVAPRVSDLDRTLHLRAGFRAMIETPMRFLFGEGVYTHKRLLYPYIRTMFAENLPGIEVNRQVRTMGLPALAVDVGFVGLALLFANLLCAMRACVSRWSLDGLRASSVLLGALALVSVWILVSNIQDMVIYFLLFMPYSPFMFLAAHEQHYPEPL